MYSINKKVNFLLIFLVTPFIFLAITPNYAIGANPTVLMKTSKGDVTIELFEKKAPISVKNFLSYVTGEFYNNLIFHRVIPGFMIQGGGFDSSMNKKKTNAPIKNEATNKVSNKRGTLAMARTNIVDSATGQFFINVVDNAFLDHKNTSDRGYGYAVFGEVKSGLDVIDKIAGVKTGYVKGFKDVPIEPVIIKSISIVKQ